MNSRYIVTYEKDNGEKKEETFKSRNTAKKFKIDMEAKNRNVKLEELSIATGMWKEVKT